VALGLLLCDPPRRVAQLLAAAWQPAGQRKAEERPSLAATNANANAAVSRGGGGLSQAAALKQLPLLLRAACSAEALATPGSKARLKVKKGFDENQLLLAHLAAAARRWCEHGRAVLDAYALASERAALRSREATKAAARASYSSSLSSSLSSPPSSSSLSQHVGRRPLAGHGGSDTGTHRANDRGGGGGGEGSSARQLTADALPLDLLEPLAAAAFCPRSTISTVRASLGALQLLARADPLRLAACGHFTTNLSPLEHSEALFSSTSSSSSSSAAASASASAAAGAVLGGDTLSSVYYLRCCAAVAFAPLAAFSAGSGAAASVGAAVRTQAYAVVCSGLADPRPRLQLEAVGLLSRVSERPASWWRALEAANTPPPASSVVSLGEEDLRGLIARGGGPTAAFVASASDRGVGDGGAGSVAGSAEGRAAAAAALGRLQAAVQRGRRGVGALGADALSLDPLPAATRCLACLLRAAVRSDGGEGWGLLRAAVLGDGEGGGGESGAGGGGGEGAKDVARGGSSGGGAGAWAWDGSRGDEALAHACCRAAADLGRCFASRFDGAVLAAAAAGGALPATSLHPDDASAAGDTAKGGGGLGGGGGSVGSVFGGEAALASSPLPPPPVGFSVVTAAGASSGPGALHQHHSTQHHNQPVRPTTLRVGARGRDAPPANHHSGAGSASGPEWWAAAPDSAVVLSAEAAGRAGLRVLADLLLYCPAAAGVGAATEASVGRQDPEPSASPESPKPPWSSSSSSSSQPAPPRARRPGPLLSAACPWPLRLRCLDALIWLAHGDDGGGSGLGGDGTHGPLGGSERPPGPSVAGAAAGTGMVAGGLWFEVERAVLIGGATLPVHAMVELVDILTARAASDGCPPTLRAIAANAAAANANATTSAGADAAVFASGGRPPSEPPAVGAALRVALAFLRLSPCDALTQALRRCWEACLRLAADASAPVTASAHSGAAAVAGAVRQAVLASAFGILDWRLVPTSRSSSSDGSGQHAPPLSLVHRPPPGMGLDAWSAAGASAALGAQWSSMERAHSAALDLLADHGPQIAGLVQHAAGEVAGEAKVDTMAAASEAVASSEALAADGVGGVAMAWGSDLAVTSLVARLTNGAALGSTGDRRRCVKGLCRLALAAPDPLRFSLYVALHELQVATSPCLAAVSKEAGTGNGVGSGGHGGSGGYKGDDNGGGGNGDGETAAAWGTEAWLGVGDLLGPCLVLLDHTYAAEAAKLSGGKVGREYAGLNARALELMRAALSA